MKIFIMKLLRNILRISLEIVEPRLMNNIIAIIDRKKNDQLGSTILNPLTRSEKYLGVIAFCLGTMLVLFILYITLLMRAFLVPIFIAFFTAFFLLPFIEKMKKTRIPYWLSITVIIVIATTLISLMFFIMIASIRSFVIDLTKPDGLLDIYKVKFIYFIDHIQDIKFFNNFIKPSDVEKIKSDFSVKFFSSENISKFIFTPLGKTFNILSSFMLYIIALILIIPGMNRFNEKTNDIFSDHHRKTITGIVKNIKTQIQSYIVSKTIMSFVTALVSYIICIAFKVEYALLWAFLIFIFNYIPVFGAIVSSMLPILMSFIQHDNIFIFIGFASLFLVSQVIMGNIIEARVMSKGVNLSPIVIFTSLLVWGYLWGIAGIFIAVPLMSAFNIICGNFEMLMPISRLISSSKSKV